MILFYSIYSVRSRNKAFQMIISNKNPGRTRGVEGYILWDSFCVKLLLEVFLLFFHFIVFLPDFQAWKDGKNRTCFTSLRGHYDAFVFYREDAKARRIGSPLRHEGHNKFIVSLLYMRLVRFLLGKQSMHSGLPRRPTAPRLRRGSSQ